MSPVVEEWRLGVGALGNGSICGDDRGMGSYAKREKWGGACVGVRIFR